MEMNNAHTILVWKTERLFFFFWRSMLKWEDSIKMDFQ